MAEFRSAQVFCQQLPPEKESCGDTSGNGSVTQPPCGEKMGQPEGWDLDLVDNAPRNTVWRSSGTID